MSLSWPVKANKTPPNYQLQHAWLVYCYERAGTDCGTDRFEMHKEPRQGYGCWDEGGREGVNKSTPDPCKCESSKAAARHLVATHSSPNNHNDNDWKTLNARYVVSAQSPLEDLSLSYNFGISRFSHWDNDWLMNYPTRVFPPELISQSTGLGLGCTETKWAIGCHHRSERWLWTSRHEVEQENTQQVRDWSKFKIGL